MILYREQVEQAIRATTIQPPFAFRWFGQPSRPQRASVRALLSASAVRQQLLYDLQQRLYSDFYLPGGAVARRRERTAQPGPDARAFITGLAAANAGSGTWSSGWAEIARTDDKVVVHDHRLDLALWLGEDDTRRTGEREVAIRMPAALPNWSPGFWLALGNAPFANRTERQVRFYWNVRPDGAALLVERLTRSLNEPAIPFRLKLLADPARYTRCDAAVLYLPESAVNRALPVIRAVYQQIQPRLKPAVPALTTRLAPGLAMAHDPDGDESYGTRCCRLLAGAMLTASDAGVTEVPARLELALAQLAEHDIAIDRPHAELGEQASQPRQITISWTPGQPASDAPARVDEDFAQVAVDIARHIVDAAIWDGPACAWLGMTGSQERGQPVYGTLGSDLYGGSAGTALFLGEVYRATGDVTCRTTALAGIRHALAHTRQIAPASMLGLYTGLPGVAVAATRLARALQEPALLDDARHLLDTIDESPSREHDLLSGTAGALIALLLLHHAAPDEHVVACALRLGNRLLDSAHRGAAGYSWRSGRRALTGLSHGASGIGVALLELAVASGEVRFRDAARAAFAWEQRLFDPAEGNWPDLRRVSGPIRKSMPLPLGASWCHGAPGIALARLRATELLADATLAAEARVALETTRRWVEQALANGDESFCLCHGLAGNADILLDGYTALGDPAFQEAARAVGVAGIERYAYDPRCWPFGTYTGPTPGLMLGLAGIGHFYLRLANPALPSILLPVPVETPLCENG